MKLNKLLFILTALILIGCMVAPEYIYSSITKVQTVKAQVKDINISLTANGKIISDPALQISSDYNIVVDKVLVHEGDKVKKGQKLIKINTKETKQLYLSGSSPDYMSANNIEEYITATKSGTVSLIQAQQELTITASTVLMEIIDISTYSAVVFVDENSIGEVKIDQEVMITGDGFKDRAYKGKIKSIAAVVSEIKPNTIQTVVEILKPDHHLKSGFNIKAKIKTGRLKDSILIPADSIEQNESNNEYVYIYENNQAKKQYVSTRLTVGGDIVISRGLTGNERIVLNPKNLQGEIIKVIAQ